jgi:hypothetical protein
MSFNCRIEVRITTAAVGVGLLVALAVNTAVAGSIPWRSGPAELAAQSAAAKVTLLEGLQDRAGEAQHLVVQLTQPADAETRAALAEQGLTLLDYVGANAYYAMLEAGRVDAPQLAADPAVAALDAVRVEWKLHPDYLFGEQHPWAIVDPAKDQPAVVAAYVVFHRDVNPSDSAALLRQYGALVRSHIRSIHTYVIEVSETLIPMIAEEDSVQWIEPPLPKFSEVNAENRERVGADIVQQPPYNLDGSGVTVLVYDGGYGRATHVDFEGRLTVYDNSGLSDHSTHVAGTIGGAGVANPMYRGMAPGVEIASYGFEQDGGLQPGFLYTDPGDMEADYGEAITAHGADISNNSIGTNTAPNGFPCEWTGDYNVTSNLIDTIVRGDGSLPPFTEPFRVVWANGNERQTSRCGDSYQSTAPPACAKNHITVGALVAEDDTMSTFSSWGPADDGRMKPDVSAPGVDVTSCSSSSDTGYTTKSGTSMASPTVCGCAALVLEDYRAHYPDDPDPRNSTLKVLFAHTAVDLGNPGPDYMFGYGSIRVQPAVDVVRDGNFLEAEVTQGDAYTVLAYVEPADTELKVTLAWDDYPAAPAVTEALVNDLDLHVYSPDNVRQYPWTLGGVADPAAPAVQNQENRLDNIEQVFVDAPAPGVWRIEIHGFSVPQGPQPFSLVATPLLINCSPQGVVSLSPALYNCDDVARVKVVDCDLNQDDAVVETVEVVVTSDSEPAGETIILTETGPATASFEALLPLQTTNAPGVLLVAHGDSVIATYIDEDDGQGGANVVVTDDATVDCLAPMISGVQAINVEPRSAQVTLTASEPVRTTVYYGTDCAQLDEMAVNGAFLTNPVVDITGLQDNVTYYFIVEAEDQAGNMVTDDNGGNCYLFTTPEVPDFFTELFASGFDLDGLKLTFIPAGTNDFYDACVEEITALPTDPAGGTTITLSDDDNELVNIGGGNEVFIYGAAYSGFYVGSNGYVTFGSGDTDYSETLEDHFDLPRISALFDDLHPGNGGSVSYKQLDDRIVVTWEEVPEYSNTGANTFQIEMFFDGMLTISYLGISASDGLAGLSEGVGLDPDYFPSDLSGLGACGPRPPTASAVEANTAISEPVAILLDASDDGLPDPPAALTYIIDSLPSSGTLTDPNGGEITGVPYTLLAGGNAVNYAPVPGTTAPDTFMYKANDGGVAPDGGDSNLAPVTITFGGPAWDPVAYDVTTGTAINSPIAVTLQADDPNGDPLTWHIASLPADGYLRTLDGTPIDSVPYTLPATEDAVRYLPPVGYNGVAMFDFYVTDFSATSNTATVTITVGGPSQILLVDLNEDPGWPMNGEWAFGVPQGLGGSAHGNPDPTGGYTGSNVLGVNLAGDYATTVGGPYFVTMGPIDLTDATEVELRFRRWLNSDYQPYASATVEVSTDGSNWTLLWENGGSPAVADSSWQAIALPATAADDAATVWFRWGYAVLQSGAFAYSGWNLDDIELWGLVPSAGILGDLNCDGVLSAADIDPFVLALTGGEAAYQAAYPDCYYLLADMNGDGAVSAADIDGFVQALTGGK